LHVNADATSLPASTLPWFWDVSWPPGFHNFLQPFIELWHSPAVGTRCLARLLVIGPTFIRASTFVKLRNGAVYHCLLSTCVFCQNFIHPHHNLDLLVRQHFLSSLGHLSGPVLLLGFKHIATYFLIFWLVSSPLKRPAWCSAVLLNVLSNMYVGCLHLVDAMCSLQFVTTLTKCLVL